MLLCNAMHQRYAIVFCRVSYHARVLVLCRAHDLCLIGLAHLMPRFVNHADVLRRTHASQSTKPS